MALSLDRLLELQALKNDRRIASDDMAIPTQPELNPMQNPGRNNQDELLRAMAEDRKRRQALLEPILQRQKASIDNQRNALESYLKNTTQRVDLSPLAALIDQSTGSNFSKSYKAPSPTTEDLMGLVTASNKQIGDSENALAGTQIKSLADQMSGRLLEGQARQQRFETGQISKFATDVTKDVNKLQSDYPRITNELTKLKDIFNTGDVRQIKASISNFARNVGAEKGALAEGDVKRAFYESLETQLDSIASKFDPNVKYDPKEIQASKVLIDRAIETTGKTYKDTLDNLKTNYGYRAQAQNIPQVMANGSPLSKIFEPKISTPKNTFEKDGMVFEDLGNGKARRIK